MDSYCMHHCLCIWLGDPRHTENGWLLPTRGKEHPSTKQKLWSVNCSLGTVKFYREQEGQRSALCILYHQSTSGPHAVERSWCVHSRNSPANKGLLVCSELPFKGIGTQAETWGKCTAQRPCTRKHPITQTEINSTGKMWKNKKVQNNVMDLRDKVDYLTEESELNFGMINTFVLVSHNILNGLKKADLSGYQPVPSSQNSPRCLQGQAARTATS